LSSSSKQSRERVDSELIGVPPDPHAPHLRPGLEGVPGELAGVLGLELVAQGLRVVVVDEDETGSGGEGVVLGEDRLVALRRGEVSDIEVGIASWGMVIAGGTERHQLCHRLGADRPGQSVQHGSDPDRELGPRHPQGRPRRRSELARPISLPSLGQVGRRLQEQRQHRRLDVGGRRVVFERGLLMSCLGEPVQLYEQLGQVHLVVSEQRGQEEVVLLRHVRCEERTDGLGLLRRVQPGRGGGELLDRRGQAAVLADHLGHGRGQLGAGGRRPVDRVLLGQRVGKHLIGQTGNQLGQASLVRASHGDGAGQGGHTSAHVLLERPVVGEHSLEGPGLGVRHRISLLVLPGRPGTWDALHI
jgi:hypothetical protein